jgi:hypothetical protein
MMKQFKWKQLWVIGLLLVMCIGAQAQISEPIYLKVSDTASMLSKYLRKSDTANLVSKYLRKSDTANMLQPYLRKWQADDTYATMVDVRRRVKYDDTTGMLSGYLRKGHALLYTDTASMLSGYSLKGHSVQYTDTALMLTPYLLSAIAAEVYATKGENNLKVNYTDTAAMLSGYSLKGHSVQYADTVSMLSPYLLSTTAAGTYATKEESNLKVSYTDTASMLSGYSLKGHSVQYADTVSMLSPYLLSTTAAGTYATIGESNLKVSYTDTASMLSGYALKGHSVQYADTVSMLSPYLLSSVAAGTYATKGESGLKVSYTDTAAMLSGYALRGQSVRYADTALMLSPYLLSSMAANTYATQSSNALKVNYTDTAAMLSGYALRGQTVQQSEVAGFLSPYLLSATAAATYATQSSNALKVNYTDTAAMLSGYALRGQTVQQNEVAGFLSPYLLSATAAATYATQSSNALKVNYTDTAAMLQGYVRLISNSSPVMGGATLNGMLNGTQASFNNTVHLARNSGVVVIGNVNPASHKLAVDGSIGARKVVINSPENWADFVFAHNYTLRPLSAVETFIKKNKHLPDVPSEKEVKEKGINVADMQAVLLRKIEELTLYIIELESRLKAVEKK